MDLITIDNQPHPIIRLPGRPDAMLDFSIATLYEVETKNINRARKNNLDKFPIEFAYQLRKEEVKKVVKIFHHLKFSSVLPWAYTWEGCNMLATILKSNIATKRAIQIIKSFTMVERGDVQLVPKTKEEFFAKAVLMAQETIQQLTDENAQKKIELNYAHKKIGYLECRKDVRSIAVKLKEAPRLVCEHYGMCDFKEAYRLILEEWQAQKRFSLRAAWRKAKRNRKGLQLNQFIMEEDYVDDYLQVVEALLANDSRGQNPRYYKQDSFLDI